jgi:hypothetical protein
MGNKKKSVNFSVKYSLGSKSIFLSFLGIFQRCGKTLGSVAMVILNNIKKRNKIWNQLLCVQKHGHVSLGSKSNIYFSSQYHVRVLQKRSEALLESSVENVCKTFEIWNQVFKIPQSMCWAFLLWPINACLRYIWRASNLGKSRMQMQTQTRGFR